MIVDDGNQRQWLCFAVLFWFSLVERIYIIRGGFGQIKKKKFVKFSLIFLIEKSVI